MQSSCSNDNHYEYLCDGRDATPVIQAAIDAARDAGGGVVQLPRGTIEVTGLTIYSRVTLRGCGESISTIRLRDGSDRNVIETENFSENVAENKLWYIEDGMLHGFGFHDFRVDGNKENNSKGYGIAIYGKRYELDNVLISNCQEGGFYSQGPDIGGQKEVDDILEALIGTIRVHKCGGNGVTYRGPHDGYIASIVVGECEEGYGLISDTKSGHYNGGCDIGRVHAYACKRGVRINTAGTGITRIVADTNYMQGVVIDAHRVQIGQIWAFRNWRTDLPEKKFRNRDGREDASIELNQACNVGTVTVRTDFGGTGIKIRGSRSQIGSYQVENSNPRGGVMIGIGVDVRASLVRVSGDVRGFSVPGSIGVRVSPDKPLPMTTINCSVVDCATGFLNVHGGESQVWNLQIHTTEGQCGFEHNGATKRSAITIISGGTDCRTLFVQPVVGEGKGAVS